MNITYVTGNHGKYLSIKSHFEDHNIDIMFATLDTEELDINDISLISKEKARQAYEVLKRPLFVTDSGFYIENYPNNPGYPGAFVKRSGVAHDIEKLLTDMEGVTDRKCYFLDCLTYYDGVEYHQFFGKSEGYLSYQIRGCDNIRAQSNLWKVFIPKNHDKTLAEMTEEERKNRHDDSTSSVEEFLSWCLENKPKIKRMN